MLEKSKKTIILKDGSGYDNYIPCGSETLSDIVIPIFMDDNIVAVLDIDSLVINDFDHIEKSCLGELLSMILKAFHEQKDFLYPNNCK